MKRVFTFYTKSLHIWLYFKLKMYLSFEKEVKKLSLSVLLYKTKLRGNF